MKVKEVRETVKIFEKFIEQVMLFYFLGRLDLVGDDLVRNVLSDGPLVKVPEQQA